MQRIELDNFRVFGTPASFELAPVTVLTGKNNSGKSSLIKAFLVLADYLEQDDQTVLRLDGKRASRHRISDWGNLRNWDSPDLDNLTLGYTQDDAQFLYEFESSGPRRPPHLYRFRMIVPGVDSMTLQSMGGGNAYQLDVAQKFIDYVAGSSEERAKLRQAAEYPQQIKVLRKELADLNTKLNDELGPDSISAFPRLIEHRQQLEATIKNLESLSAQAQASAGIYFQATVSLADLMANPTISTLIQTALNRYVQENVPSDDEDVDENDLNVEDNWVILDEDGEVNEDAVELAKHDRRQKLQEASEKKQNLELSKEQGNRVLFRFSQAVEKQMKFELAHLSANRTHQARLYLTGTHYSEINAIAENFHRLGAFADGEAEAFLVEWLPRFGIGDNVQVELVDNVAIRITVAKENKEINLADLGFGAGQILTVLLQIAALIQDWEAKSHEARLAARHNPILILIEEPEANLHPQFQSLLAELFAAVVKETKYGFRFILESHSEYFIRNIQVLVKNHGNSLSLWKFNFGRNSVSREEKSIDLFKVYYLDVPSESNGKKHGHEMRLREDGVFMDEFGEGFLVNHAADLAFKLF